MRIPLDRISLSKRQGRMRRAVIELSCHSHPMINLRKSEGRFSSRQSGHGAERRTKQDGQGKTGKVCFHEQGAVENRHPSNPGYYQPIHIFFS